MTTTEMNMIIDGQLDICKSLLIDKGKEYAFDEIDRLQAFKTAATIQDTTPMKALAGMMAKHTISVYDMIEHGVSDPLKWEEKITDHINYLLLLKCLNMDEIRASERDSDKEAC